MSLAQQYYIDPNTGKREILMWIVTPLGTDGRYRTDPDTGSLKPILFKGDPIKKKVTLATLPNGEKVKISRDPDGFSVLVEYVNTKIVKRFEDRTFYIQSNTNPYSYIAVKTEIKDTTKVTYRVFIRAFGAQKEVEANVEKYSDTEKVRFWITIPGKMGTYQIEDIQLPNSGGYYYELICPDQQRIRFEPEYLN